VRRPLLTLFAIALVLRVLFCFIVVPFGSLPLAWNDRDFFRKYDGYLALADNVLRHGTLAFVGNGPPTIYRAPAYPAALAGTLLLIPDPVAATLVLNCIASALTCVVVGMLAVRLYGPGVSVWFLLPVALFPASFLYCCRPLSDVFLGLTLTLYLYALVLLAAQPTLGRALFVGMAFAVTALTKSTGLPLALVAVLYALFRRPSMLRPLLASLCLSALLIAPWSWRNYRVTGRWIPITGGAGFNLLVGNFMVESGEDPGRSFRYGLARAAEHVRDEYHLAVPESLSKGQGWWDVAPELDDAYGRAAVRMWLSDPWLLPRKVIVNAFRFFFFASGPWPRWALNAALNLATLVLAGVSLAGLVRRGSRTAELLIVMLAAYVVVYALIIVHTQRFAMPILMVLLPCAVVPIARWVKRGVSATGPRL